MAAVRAWFLIVIANICLATGVLIFAKAFFPYKPFLPGLAEYDELVNDPAPAQFDKLVFMVVDALRTDFVYSNQSNFKFTQSLISSGHAIPFTGHATSPTVTMPRVKALTTGSIPGFLDMILNLAESDSSSTLATQDNWLAQIKKSGGGEGKRLNMFGDDTWLKLFPGMFGRVDGTVSFFVSDFTEVDNNVTRHLDAELAVKDWDATILHYLGLDHIGHKSGPRSQHMRPKQAEMDGIVKRIYTSIQTSPHLKSTLFVLVGDHGMNDVGNHGGSSAGETSAAMVLMSPRFAEISKGVECPGIPRDEEGFAFYERVEQSDLVPTLASLLQFPIPKNNLGLFIPAFLPLWDEQDQVRVLKENAQQLIKLLIASYSDFPVRVIATQCPVEGGNEIDELACLWREVGEAKIELFDEDPEVVLPLLEKFTKKCQRHLASAATNYNIPNMVIGVSIAGLALVLLGGANYAIDGFASVSLGSLFFWILSLCYGWMMSASSYVEEEQLYWYWMGSAWCFALFYHELSAGDSGIKSVVILFLLRIARRWNQTGQKHAGAPDIAKDFLSTYPTLLWILIIATYANVFHRLRQYAFSKLPRQLSFAVASTSIGASLLFKLGMASLDTAELIPWWLDFNAYIMEKVSVVIQGKATFLSILSILVYTVAVEWRSNASKRKGANLQIVYALLSIFLITQSRLVNIPLFLIFDFMQQTLRTLPTLSSTQTTLTILIFQHISFFALGNSNAISSIDLSNAYNGVGDYNVLFVGVLTFVSNWAGPIFWSSAAALLFRKGGVQEGGFLRHVETTSRFYVVAMVCIMVACMALRTHLFIWTVFSPKFLFAMGWSVGFHGLIDIGLGSLLQLARD